MKRTAIIALALLIAFMALGCNESLDYTSLNMGDYDSQFELDQDGPVTVLWFTDVTLGGGSLNAAAPDTTITVNFTNVSPPVNWLLDVDVVKHTTLDKFAPELRKVLKFYEYTGKGNNTLAKLIPPPISDDPLNYEVVKWENYIATIKFPDITPDITDRIEARLDQYTYTHHNGRQLDMNNDGKIDEYDLIYLGQVTVTGATKTGYSYGVPDSLTRYNPYVGLGTGIFGYTAPAGGVPGFFNTIINPFALAPTLDTNNYVDKLNAIYKLQKFDLTKKKWVNDDSISGNYTASIGEFRYTINAPENDVRYRVVIADFAKLKEFTIDVEFYGYKQKLHVDAFAPGSPSEVVSVVQPVLKADPDATTDYVIGTGVFTVENVAHDDNYRNVVVTVSFVPANMGTGVGGAGLPDPAPYMQKKQFLLGYGGSGAINTANQSTWNDLIFIPVTIIPYKNLPTDAVDNRWKMILPAGHVLPLTGMKYFFISPDYKTLGDTGGGNVRKFGKKENLDFVYNGNFMYEAYPLATF